MIEEIALGLGSMKLDRIAVEAPARSRSVDRITDRQRRGMRLAAARSFDRHGLPALALPAVGERRAVAMMTETGNRDGVMDI